MRMSNKIREVLWGIAALAVGAALVGVPLLFIRGFVMPGSISFSFGKAGVSSAATAGEEPVPGTQLPSLEVNPPNEGSAYSVRTLEAKNPEIPVAGRAIVADLGVMTIRLVEDGETKREFPILSKGKPGSPWETPTGMYAVKTKEENHFSSIGEVWMPYSMQFFGNFFIHGWPYYTSGKPVPEGFSGGCIRLSTADAGALFKEALEGMPVIVMNGLAASTSLNGAFGYFAVENRDPLPRLSAESALVADLESGYVFYEREADAKRPIASLSKLMTALVSLEAVNQYQKITITKEDTDTYGDAGGLFVGQKLTTGELLWPLLLSSSNDAAVALARTMGMRQFVSIMNEKTKSLGLEDTSFVEPSGLSSDNQSTTIDLFRLVQHLWANKRSILDMTRTRTHKGWRNIHPFAAKGTFIGGKTGYTDEAQKTSISVFSLPFGEFTERKVAAIILGSDDIRTDTERLRLWAKDNFVYGPWVPVGEKPKMTPKQKAPADGEFSLLFVGDIMLNRGVEEKILLEGAGDWDFPFRLIKNDLDAADITFANLEGPISDKGVRVGSKYSFRMNPLVVDAIKNAGVDIVSFANNHAGDWGRAAFEDTMRRLRTAGVEYAGAGWNRAEALSPTIFELRGRRIGYVAFSDVGPAGLAAAEASSGIAVIPAGEAGVLYVENAVRQAKDEVDILVASFHYGEEYLLEPTKREKVLAKAAINAGARIVAGHHPHVVQPVEEYDGGIILYSLGNFIFDQYFSKDTMSGIMVKVEFEGDRIRAVVPIPVKLNEDYQPEVE